MTTQKNRLCWAPKEIKGKDWTLEAPFDCDPFLVSSSGIWPGTELFRDAAVQAAVPRQEFLESHWTTPKLA